MRLLSSKEVAKVMVMAMINFKALLLERRLSDFEIQMDFLERASPDIEEYRLIIVKRFDEIEKEVLAKLKKPGKDVYNEAKERWIKKDFDVEKWLFSRQKWQGTFSADNKFMVGATMVTAAQQKLDDFAIGMSFDMVDKRALIFLATNAKNAAWSITNTQYEALRKELMEGMAEGESIPKLRARVMSAMAVAKKRAELIARTEILRASNRSGMIAMMQSGVVEGKQWLATMDARTCPSCEEMDGATMPLERNFFEQGVPATVGGIDYSFDYEEIQHAPLHPDCRCTLLAIIRQGAYKCAGKGASWVVREPGFSVGSSVPCKLKSKGERGHVTTSNPYSQMRKDYKNYYGKEAPVDLLNRYMSSVIRFTEGGAYEIRMAQLGKLSKFTSTDAYKVSLAHGNKLEELLNFMPKWTKTKPMLRGMNGAGADFHKMLKTLMDAKPGDLIKMDTTSHWTSAMKTAEGFDGDVIFKINGGCSKSTSIKHMSLWAGENEVMVSKDAVFKITKIKWQDDKFFVTLKEVVAGGK